MMQKHMSLSITRKLTVTGLVLAAVGIIVQYFFKVVGLPTIPIGPIILLVAAAMVAFGPWRWTPIVGVIVSLFVLVGFAMASITDWERIPLSNPAEVGGFIGAVLQLLGLIMALVAALVATRQNYPAETPGRG
jgi:hypothetical protein